MAGFSSRRVRKGKRVQIEERVRVVRIMIVEDHVSVRQALAHMLDLEPGFSVVAQVGSLAEAREELEKVDVAILDLALPDGNGIDLIEDLHALKHDTMVLVLSASISNQQYAQAVEAGAAGIVHKSASIEEIIDSVKRLHRGESLLSLEELVEVFRTVSRQRQQEREAKLAIQSLSKREKELLQALAEGLESKEIAQKLHITAATERSHFLRIFTKLGVHSRLQVLLFALRHGVVKVG